MELAFKVTSAMKDVPMHYCPGCTHGIVHRMVAEVLDELKIRERSVGVAPVGCAVLIYNYINTDFMEAPHGRAPALATGAKRSRPDMIVYTYQGDGDLASIGFNEIFHAANRGEKITVIFINNGIYGMTGGQMAPTTLPGQVTTTSPDGRDVSQTGYPVSVSEALATQTTPGFIVRCSTHDSIHQIKTKKLIRQAFQNQIDNRCFSLVEILSTCPTNWGMTPQQSLEHVRDNTMQHYKLGILKSPEGE